MLASITGLVRSIAACAALALVALTPVWAGGPAQNQQSTVPASQTNTPASQTNTSVAQLPGSAETSKQQASLLPGLSGIASLQGLIVHHIDFRGVSGARNESLLDIIAQKPSEPLDRVKVRSSLQTLYATGRFASLQVEADRTQNNQVTLVFVARENYFIGGITVDGIPKGGPSANQLVTASKLALGEMFTHEMVELALTRMKKIMEDHGFYQATITADEIPHDETQQMDINFHVQGGEPARVGDVVVRGKPGYSDGQIRDIAKLHSGDKVRGDTITRALTRLRNKYQKQKRLESQVAVVERKYHPESNTLDYTFEIQRGPTVDIHVEGAKVSKGQLKKYVPVYEENAVDDDLLNEGRRNLRDYFQTQGYFDVAIEFKHEADPRDDHLHIVYDINRGERHKLSDVVLEGNKYFGSDLIRERLIMQPAGILLSHGRFSQSILTRDIQSIENLYQANGFAKVKVTSAVQGNVNGDSGRMRVVLRIDEGPQTRVNSLEIVGTSSIPAEEVRSLLTTIEGQPFSDMNVASDRDSVVNYYFNHGFSDVQFETSAKPHAGDATRMDVVYKIIEGKRVFVDRILVSGLENTRPHVVTREFAIKPGDPLSQAAMLESQRRLYDLGIFNEVNMAVQNPNGDAVRKNLLFQTREAKRYTFNYGFGIEIATGANQSAGTAPQGKTGVSPRVSFDVTRINFRGRDQSIIFKSRLGRLQRRALLSFDSPRWFDLPNWRFTVSTFYDNTRDVNTFASERLEASTQLEQVLSRATTLLYRFSYRRVKVDPASFPEGFTPELVPLFSKPVRVGMPSIILLRDRRDDPINATKGNYTTADFGVASGYFGSEANFGRLLIQNATYHSFKRNYVFARNTRIGFETPYANSDFVPLPERFFAGGGNSLRGFAINQAGPRDPQTGTPLGGNAMFVNNLELRLPPVALPFVQENLSFVIFHDMGNVFGEGKQMVKNLVRFSQRNREGCRTLTSTCDFNYMSHAVGGGLRYRTPIGPVRFDLGYNLNPPAFQVLQGANPHSETLRRFNFFFSIGQTF
ncbi:MAG TPA: outer membrane protein assembly factor BamA [Clostridia bacterium]|nr:outer membrane protein assembly factor BamA [Clostridia bacterium]